MMNTGYFIPEDFRRPEAGVDEKINNACSVTSEEPQDSSESGCLPRLASDARERERKRGFQGAAQTDFASPLISVWGGLARSRVRPSGR